MICVTAQGIAQQAAEAEKAARHPSTGRFTSEIAAGHPWGPPSETWPDVTTPDRTVQLASVSGSEGALASSIAMHQGSATVQQYDAASAWSPALAGQLGPRCPSGVPGQPPVHVAPTTVGAVFRAPVREWGV